MQKNHPKRMRIKTPHSQTSSSVTSFKNIKNKSGFFWTHPVEVLYQDRDVMVFEKPAGVLTIANPKELDKNLVDLVNHQFTENQNWKLFPCHRLDRETSGAILFAKSLDAQHRMMDMFKLHEIKKIYTACVQGQLQKNSGEIRSQISEDGKLKSALSFYSVIQKKEFFTVIEVQPMTGRTNQIRIQFSEIGHPLVGDRKFSVAKNFSVKFKRTALHASSLEWISPFSKKMIHVKSDLPEDMRKLIDS